MPAAEAVNTLTAIALYLASGGFLAAGSFLLGKGDAKELAWMVIVLGTVQVITAGLLIYYGGYLNAIMVIIFAYIWLTFGPALLLGTNMIVLANQLITAGVMYAAITAFLVTVGGPVMLPIMTASYTLVIFLLAGGIYGSQRAPGILKVAAWVLIIEAFVTVLYPTICLALGWPLP